MSVKFSGWRSKRARLTATFALALSAFGFVDQANAGKLFTGQFGANGTWNVYERIDNPLTFEEAWFYAQKAPNPTGGPGVGHLVVLGSAGENTFVNTNGPGDNWIGLTDRFGLVAGAFESQGTADNTTMGWRWATGEALTYTNWNGGEPNDAGGPTAGGEDAGQMVGNGGWNDNASGFNQDSPAVDPNGMSGPEGQATFGYAIEWDTNLSTQPTLPPTRPNPNVLNRVFPTPLARLPGPNGTASAFGVRELRDLGGVKNSREGVARIAAGAGTPVDGTAPRIDLRDPQTNGGNTGVVGGTEAPFITHVDGVEDNDVQTVIKGTFVVPAGQGGLYTFNGHSDDGFAMRILSQKTPASPLVQHKFTEAKNGYVDEDGSLVWMTPTGDSNTQGLINLAPGKYDVEFTAWENGGGAYWELSTARGNFVNPPANVSPQWLLLGDPSTKAQSGASQPVRLTGDVTVNNYLGATGSILDVLAISGSATPDATANFNELILSDGVAADICCGRPGANLPAAQVNKFPIVTTPPDFLDFSTKVTGSFQVLNTDGLPGETLTFTLQSDDASALHIIGQDFTAVNDFSGDGDATLQDLSGTGDTWLTADIAATGNVNTFGKITLPEGTYSFEAFQRQGTGDAGLEVWAAAGDFTATGFNTAAFFPLSAENLPGNTLAANNGLALVAGPGTGPTTSGGDFDGDGDVDGADFLRWQRGQSPNPVSAADLAAWKASFGTATPVVGAVPEPASIGLAASVVGVLGGFGRRRRGVNAS